MQVGKMLMDNPLVLGAPGYVCPTPNRTEEVGFVRYGASIKSVTMTIAELLAFENEVDALFGTGGLKKAYTKI